MSASSRAAAPEPLTVVGTGWIQVPAIAGPNSPTGAKQRTQLGVRSVSSPTA